MFLAKQGEADRQKSNKLFGMTRRTFTKGAISSISPVMWARSRVIHSSLDSTDIEGAMAERRSALVIGNNAYAKLVPLRNAVNDASELADTLGKLRFHVTCALNTKIVELENAIGIF